MIILGEKVKAISGVVLVIIGALIIYATYSYALIDIFFVVGFVLLLLGFGLIIGHFVDSSANKTRVFLSELLNSEDNKSNTTLNNSLKPKKANNAPSAPLWVQDEEPDYSTLNQLNYDDYDGTVGESSYINKVYEEDYYDDSKQVLDIVEEPVYEETFDNTLNFTPNYDKPLKVTRRPKKREHSEETPVYFESAEDRTAEIAKALSEEDIIIPDHDDELVSLERDEPREIKIDINNPESLPVPKLLKSFVIGQNGISTSQEAFETLIYTVSKEVMLEIPTLHGLSDNFLANIPSIYSRVILQEFSTQDINMVMLVSSLIKQGVHIRTIPKVNTVNLIIDDSSAVIISENVEDSDMEYGAVYTDRNSISEIRSSFDRTWDMAKELDQIALIGDEY